MIFFLYCNSNVGSTLLLYVKLSLLIFFAFIYGISSFLYFSLQAMLFQQLRWLTLSLSLWSDKNSFIKRSHELYKTDTKKLNKKSITILRKKTLFRILGAPISFSPNVYIFILLKVWSKYMFEKKYRRGFIIE